MQIPGLGAVTKGEFGWYFSEPIAVPVLAGKSCRLVVEDYDQDKNPEEFHVAIRNFLLADYEVLKKAEPYIFEYYKRCVEGIDPDDEVFVEVKSPSDVWSHIELGSEPMFTRRHYGDKGIYVSLECGCDWEEEHGLQIVFKNVLKVNKVGDYNGHLTNSDAFDDDSLEDVIFY